MTHHPDTAYSRDILPFWSELAEERLRHLTELFKPGRKRRFHSECRLYDLAMSWRGLAAPGC
jgi:hypothetical protein